MSRSFWWIIPLACLMLAAGGGCIATQNIRLRSELKGAPVTGPLTLLTTDSALYTLEHYRLKDSSIAGSGTVLHRGTVEPFDGELALKDIGYIQAQKRVFFQTLVAAAFVGGFIALAANGTRGGDGAGVQGHVRYTGPEGGGSCPFVYSWDGKHHVLEGEAFGVGLGKALELTTCTTLRSLAETNGTVAVRLTNERPETHYFNVVKLAAVETGVCTEVYADAYGTLWPVSAPVPPLSARDNAGRDITAAVTSRDGRYWESDLTSAAVKDGYEDVVELTAVKPAGANEGSLVIHAINTHFSESVFGNIYSYLGDEALPFIRAAEEDTTMIRLLKQWRQEASLTAYVFNGETWEEFGMLAPEANVVPFSKLIRCATPWKGRDTVRIRLRALADVWKIDAIALDWSPAKKLAAHEMQLLSAAGPRETDVRGVLSLSDRRYATLVPQEKIDLQFTAFTPTRGNNVTYAVYVGGYLHEWPSTEGSDALRMLAGMIGPGMKIPYLKTLLGQREIFLPLLYADWCGRRERSGQAAR